MKILQLISDRHWLGRTRYALDLGRSFGAGGYDTEVLTKGEERVDSPFRESGIKMGHLPLGGGFDFLTPVMLARRLRRDPSRCTAIYTYTSRDTSSALKERELIGGVGKDIRVIRVRASGEGETQSHRVGGGNVVEDATVFRSEAAREAFLKANPGAEAAKLHVIRNSVIPPEEKYVQEKPESPLTILYLGRICEGKGLETLVKAVGKLTDIPLRLRIGGVGLGPYVSSLKGEVWRQGVTDRVEWLSFLDDVYSEIRRADIGIVPTVNPETSGLSILEFMSQGVPVIAADDGSVGETITSGSDGLIVEGGDADKLADAMRTLALSSETRHRLGEEARAKFYRKFGYDRFMRDTKALLTSLFE